MKVESMRENVTEESLERTIDRMERIKKAQVKVKLSEWSAKEMGNKFRVNGNNS